MLLVITFISSSGSRKPWSGMNEDTIVLTGSTPCDNMIRSMLHLPAEGPLDFMRWELTLSGDDKKGTFMLKLNYGESQPNTLGFREGGKNAGIAGNYNVVLLKNEMLQGKVYSLQGNDGKGILIRMIKVTGNVFHLLTHDDRLLIGNGGWSYTLNRKNPLPGNSPTVLSGQEFVLSNPPVRSVFDGRTPCFPVASEYNFPAKNDCFKIKWRLILLRDPVTNLPGEYILENVFTRKKSLTGKWGISLGTPSSPGAVIYRLDPDKPEKSLSFFAASRDVLFFLDRNDQLYTGNSDFSFTLNRVNK